jgi:hypothetical protein
MSEQRELFYLAAILFVLGLAFLLVPQYANYCSRNDAAEKYCTGHRQLYVVHLPLCAAIPVVAEAEVLGS